MITQTADSQTVVEGFVEKKKKIGKNVEKLKLKAFLIKKSFFKLKLKAKLKNIFF